MKYPRGAGEVVLYLDYDGVLHHENVMYQRRRGAYMNPAGYRLFEHANLLDELLRPHPELRIVLSTSWVRRFGCYGTARKLPPGLRNRVIGATFHSSMHRQAFAEMARGVQVWQDVQRRKPRDWVALDDDFNDWPECCLDKYVRTDEVLGISAPAVFDELERHLARIYKVGA